MTSAAAGRFSSFWNGPTGPKTVFFWAPAMKWGIVLAGINDLFRPADQISVAQNTALALTGSIWVRYCFVITPVNYSLAAVNFFVGSTGLVQLARVAQYVEYAHTVTVIRTLRRPQSPLLLRLRPTPSRTEERRVRADPVGLIGRNFADHAKELNNAVPTEPFFFLKPTSSYIGSGDAIEIPRGVVAHHEALAIDMTARNVQDKAKKAGLPWSTAKGFDTFTPISTFVPKDAIADPSNVNLWLKVNDELRQNGNTQDMIFHIPALLAHVSSIMTLDVGDVILTGTLLLLTQGTPKGVSQINPGDHVTAGMQLPGSSKILAELKLRAMQREGGFVFQG
ncbi:hypothetical protein CBS14141_001857 [Malassezia furfur]|nr:hypothetical protein CBS14141_001857 [Malassezia furfur]